MHCHTFISHIWIFKINKPWPKIRLHNTIFIVRRIYIALNAETVSSSATPHSPTQAGLAGLAGFSQSGRFRSSSSAERLAALPPNASAERLAGHGDQGSSNSKLSEAGREFGVDLGRYLKVNYQMSGSSRPKSSPLEGDYGSELMVLTGTSSLHTETVSHLRMLFRCYNTPLLNELRGGDLQGMVSRLHVASTPCTISFIGTIPICYVVTQKNLPAVCEQNSSKLSVICFRNIFCISRRFS